jgi:hypothetical protein
VQRGTTGVARPAAQGEPIDKRGDSAKPRRRLNTRSLRDVTTGMASVLFHQVIQGETMRKQRHIGRCSTILGKDQP